MHFHNKNTNLFKKFRWELSKLNFSLDHLIILLLYFFKLIFDLPLFYVNRFARTHINITYKYQLVTHQVHLWTVINIIYNAIGITWTILSLKIKPMHINDHISIENNAYSTKNGLNNTSRLCIWRRKRNKRRLVLCFCFGRTSRNEVLNRNAEAFKESYIISCIRRR